MRQRGRQMGGPVKPPDSSSLAELRKYWRGVWRWLDANAEYVMNAFFYAYLASIIVVEVIRRYVFSYASSWGEETAVYAFIWMTYIAAARGARNRSHLSIDIIRRHLGRTGKFLLHLLSDVCFLILAVVVIVTSLKAVSNSMQYQQTFQGADIPMWLAIVGVPTGWTLIVIRVCQRSLRTITLYRRGESEAEAVLLKD